MIYGYSEKHGGVFDFSPRGVRCETCKQCKYRLSSNKNDLFIKINREGERGNEFAEWHVA